MNLRGNRATEVMLHVHVADPPEKRRRCSPGLDPAAEAQPDHGNPAEHASEVERARVPPHVQRQEKLDGLQTHREDQNIKLRICTYIF